MKANTLQSLVHNRPTPVYPVILPTRSRTTIIVQQLFLSTAGVTSYLAIMAARNQEYKKASLWTILSLCTLATSLVYINTKNKPNDTLSEISDPTDDPTDDKIETLTNCSTISFSTGTRSPQDPSFLEDLAVFPPSPNRASEGMSYTKPKVVQSS